MAEDVKVLKVVVDGIDQYLADVKSIEKYTKLIEEELSKTGKSLPTSEIKKFAQEAAKAEKEIDNLGKGLDKFGNKIEKSGGRIKSLKGGLREMSIGAFQAAGAFGGIGDAIVGSILGGGISQILENVIGKLFEMATAESALTIASNEVFDSLSSEFGLLASNSSILLDTTKSYEDRNLALQVLQEQYPSYFANINLETASYEDLSVAVLAAADSLMTLANAKAQQQLIDEAAIKVAKTKNQLDNIQNLTDEQKIALAKTQNTTFGLLNTITTELGLTDDFLTNATESLNTQLLAESKNLQTLTLNAAEATIATNKKAEADKKAAEEKKASEDAYKKSLEESKSFNEAFNKAQIAATRENISNLKEGIELAKTSEDIEGLKLKLLALKNATLETFNLSKANVEESKTFRELNQQINDNNLAIELNTLKIAESIDLLSIKKAELEAVELTGFNNAEEISSLETYIALEEKKIVFNEKTNKELLKSNIEALNKQKNLQKEKDKIGSDSASSLEEIKKIEQAIRKKEEFNIEQNSLLIQKSLLENRQKSFEISQQISSDASKIAAQQSLLRKDTFDNNIKELQLNAKKYTETFKGLFEDTDIQLSFDSEGLISPESIIQAENTIKKSVDSGNEKLISQSTDLLNSYIVYNERIVNEKLKLAEDLKQIDIDSVDSAQKNAIKSNELLLKGEDIMAQEVEMTSKKLYKSLLSNYNIFINDKKELSTNLTDEEIKTLESDFQEVITLKQQQEALELSALDRKYAILIEEQKSNSSEYLSLTIEQYKLERTALVDKFNDEIQIVKDKSNELVEEGKKVSSNFNMSLQDSINYMNQAASQGSQIMSNIFTLVLDKQQEQIDAFTENITNVEEQINETLGKINELESDLEGKRSGRREAVLRGIEIEKEREESLLAHKLQLQEELKKAEKKAFVIRQAQAISQALISGALASINLWANNLIPYPAALAFNIPLQIGIAALTATEVAIIASQKFAKGGFTSNNPSNLGERDETGFRVAGVVHENEWVAPSWMLESPEYSKTIQNLEGARQNKFASGGFTSPDFDTINNSISSDNAMRMLRQDNMIMLDRIEQLSNRPIYTIATDVANVNNKVNNRIKTNTIGG